MEPKLGQPKLRVFVVLTALVGNLPFSIMLVSLLAELSRGARGPNFTSNAAFFGGLLVVGVLPLPVSGVLILRGHKASVLLHLLAVIVSLILTFCSAGFIALGGGKDIFGWFLLALLLLVVSLIGTVVLAARMRLGAPRGQFDSSNVRGLNQPSRKG